ncbi:hypothetical protein ACHAXR_011634 [Thalassiosira sp. AJA248-18]
MFSRYRRSASSPNGIVAAQRRRSADGGGSNHDGNNDQNNAAAALISLNELRNALDRLEFLTEKIAGKDEDGKNNDNGKTSSTAALAHKKPVSSPKAGKKEEDATATNIADQSTETSTKDINDDNNITTPIKKSIVRSPSAAASDIRQNTNATFLPISTSDENEMIELIRRIAELVVLSEVKASQLLSIEAAAQNASDSQSGGESTGESSEKDKEKKRERNEYNEDVALPYLALFELFCERNALANIVNIVTGVAFLRQKEASSNNQCENDNESTPTNSSSTPTNNKHQQQSKIITHLLPPLTIATQAVQSISILVQNVSRATSLYFLLSNNRVNDLIKLPLHLYKRAEMNALHARYNEKYSNPNNNPRRGGRGTSKQQQQQNNKQLPPMPPNLLNYQSSEMGELTTHFVSFLKSLAMRVNAETLQFFLSFPLNESSGGSGNNGNSSEEKEDDAETTTAEASAAAAESTDDTSETNNKAPTKSSATTTATRNSNPTHALSYLERRQVVEFPLYARALEFCTPEQDSFVRVTAMNVCMNIIRLATVCRSEDEDLDERSDNDGNGDNDGDDDDDDVNGQEEDATSCTGGQSDTDGQDNGHVGPQQRQQQQQHHEEIRQPLPTSTPSGTLDAASALPLQDRIAIAQYACHPRRVSDLVSPLFARLTGQFGLVEGTVRALEELNNSSSSTATKDDTATTTTKKKSAAERKKSSKTKAKDAVKDKHESERARLQNTIQDLLANVQDELLLLDDLLRVGLISLNEQSIEMMLATFVYPMLLQPLLLPLHRFSLSKQRKEDGQKKGGEEGMASLQKGKKLVITPLSPPPFSGNEEEASTSNDSSDSSASNGGPASSPATTDTNTNNKQTSYSSCEMDLAPSKTALFGISVIFDTISNPTFRHLLLTALLHPLSPEASGGVVISATPRITLPKSAKRSSSCSSSDDFQLEIRMEENQARASMEREVFQKDINVYTFGTEPNNFGGGSAESEDKGGGRSNVVNHGDFADTCVFILAPALVDMLRNNTCAGANDNNDKKDLQSCQSATITTRPNPYRNILLSSISGSNEMVALQSLATAALYAAVSSVDGSIVRKIMFPSISRSGEHDGTTANSKPESDGVKETLKYLCQGIVNTFVTYDGWWKAQFNTVAARTLMDVISFNTDYISLVESLVGDVRLQAAEFLMTLPSHLDNKSRSSSEGGAETTTSSKSNKKPNNNPAGDKQHLETWLLDRFYFDQADKFSNSVVENVCYLKEQQAVTVGSEDGGDDNDDAGPVASKKKEQYRYGLQVMTNITITGTSGLLCEGRHVVDNMIVAEEAKGNTPFHCATSWALACLYLDAFCVKLSKLSAASLDDNADKQLPRRTLSYISSTGSEDENDSTVGSLGYSLAHISSKFAIAMLDEGESSEKKASAPTHGSAVGLVAHAAFPCVCEVSSTFASLFTGRTCISNEGISWQSLYLVVVGKWAVLAEPADGGTGGEGRVITACRLACLAVKRDSSALVNNKTPARRLLVAHASLDPRPPSLFVVDSSSSSSASSSRRSGGGGGGPNLGPDGLRLTRSRMDLWFEDANAAGHACRVLQAKIAKARARRGGRIQAALLAR